MNPRIFFHSTNRSTYDADAQAFFNATAISDSTQKTAVNTLVTDLKTNNIWSSLKAIYPIVGGTGSTHKFNLKDPRDLDAAFRLSFVGSWTHSSTGMIGTTTAYADSFYVPSVQSISNLMSMGIYLRTNSNGTFVDIGALSPTNKYVQIYSRFSDVFYAQINTNNVIDEHTANTDSRGWFLGARTGTTNNFIQKNATLVSFSTAAASPTVSVYLGAQNNNGASQLHCNREIAFAILGSDLTPTQATSLYTIIQNYQTTLSRQL